MDDQSESRRASEGEEPPSINGQQQPAPAAQRTRIAWHILLGIVVGIALSLYLARRFFADPSPELTRQALNEAQAKWQRLDIADYRVEVEVQSRQTETYAVEVRGDLPQQAWRNGQPLRQVRVFDTWSVEGMFATMSDDLELAERRRTGQDGPDGSGLTLRCTFHEQTGVPLRYKRLEWGKDLEVTWRITRLEAIEPDGSRRPLLAAAK